jgi:hypothetical protein
MSIRHKLMYNLIFVSLVLSASLASLSFIEFVYPSQSIEASRYDDDDNINTTYAHQPTTTINNKTEAMLQRGNIAMGFDQEKITHKFIPTETGGEIIIRPINASDPNTLNLIREHIIDIQNDFSNGNFTKPFFIHAEQVPGTNTMIEKKDLIEYDIRQINNGSILSMITNEKEVINAIRDFMEYQGSEHLMH